MTSPAILIRALNINHDHLHNLFENKEEFDACWETSKIERKKIVVEKYASIQDLKMQFKKTLKLKRI